MASQAMFSNCVMNQYYGHDAEIHWKDVAIAQAVIAACAASGYRMRLYDGEDWATRMTHDPDVIEKELFATGEEVLYVYDSMEKRVGYVFFVWGNAGWDAINDNSTTLDMLGLMKDAEKLSDRFSDDDIAVFHVAPLGEGFAVYADSNKCSEVLKYAEARELCRKMNFGEINGLETITP